MIRFGKKSTIKAMALNFLTFITVSLHTSAQASLKIITQTPETNINGFFLNHLEERAPGQFYYDTQLTQRHKSDFKNANGFNYNLLKIVFTGLKENEFQLLKNLYSSGKSKTEWDSKKEAYELKDFLIPQMQALIGNRFESEGDVHSNCWGTAYEIARGAQSDFTFFYAEPNQVLKVFENSSYSFPLPLSTKLQNSVAKQEMQFQKIKAFREKNIAKYIEAYESGTTSLIKNLSFPKSAKENTLHSKLSEFNISENANLRFGDMLIITQEGDFQTFKNEKGIETVSKKLAPRTLVHAAIFVDQNLYFEKTAYNDDAPYRLVRWSEIYATYGNLAKNGTRYMHRRFDARRPLPHPETAFATKSMQFASKEQSLSFDSNGLAKFQNARPFKSASLNKGYSTVGFANRMR